MPAGKLVPAFDRRWLALVLTVQVFVGASFDIAVQLVYLRESSAARFRLTSDTIDLFVCGVEEASELTREPAGVEPRHGGSP